MSEKDEHGEYVDLDNKASMMHRPSNKVHPHPTGSEPADSTHAPVDYEAGESLLEE